MTRWRHVCALLAALFVVGWLAAADDKKAGDEKDTTPPRAKGQLPQNFKKVGLNDEQVQRIYRIQADYKAKIDELEMKIKELRQQQRAEEYKVLTDSQRTRLREIAEEKASGEAPKKTATEAKKDDTKKDDTKKDDVKKDDAKKP